MFRELESKVPRKAQDLLQSEKCYGVISISSDDLNGEHYEIDGLALSVWRMIDGQRTVCDILTDLESSVGVVYHEKLKTDIIQLFQELESNHLIVWES